MFKQIAVLSIACVGLASAQAPAAPAGPRLITVNVMVTKDKKPVKDLTKADFVIEDKNKAQDIVFFAIADDSKTTGALDAAISSNRIDSSGKEMSAATIILYDRVNNDLGQLGRIRNEALKVLAAMKPTDRVGFYSLGLGLTMIRDYTEEAGALVNVAKALQSNTPAAQMKTEEEKSLHASLTAALTPIQNVQQQQQRVNITYPAFQLIARHLQGVPGRRNVLWIAGSFPLTFGGTEQERRANDEAEIEGFRQVLNNAGVSLYPINPAGAGANFAGATLSGQQTMQLLADSSGGEAFRSANDIVQPLREVVASTTYSYVLGFYPEAGSLDDKNHIIKVTLAKKPETDKAKAVHRKDYMAWSPNSSAPAVQMLKVRTTLKDAMEQRVLETGVGLLGVANPVPGNPAVQALDIRIDPRDLRFEPKDGKWVAKLKLSLGTENPNGTARMLGEDDIAEAALTDAQWKEAMEVGGIDIRRNIEVGTGASGTLRIGVQDSATGVMGTVRVRYGAR